MDETLSQLREMQTTIDTLTRQAEQRELEYAALLDATKVLQDDRDRLVDLQQQSRDTIKAQQQQIEELEVANKVLTNRLWGRRSERRTGSESPPLFPDLEPQDDVDPGVTVAGLDDAQAKIDEQLIKDWEARRRKAKERRQQQGRNETFPEHLERRDRLFDLSDEEKEGMRYIGDSITERLRFEPPKTYVERIIRCKYVVEGKPEVGVFAAPAPIAIVEGCRYDFDVIAAILAQKFAFHQPTYRQQDWFAQCGWFPSRSTINDLINYSADVSVPLFELMDACVLGQRIVHIDETTGLLLTRGSLDAEQEAILRKRRKSKPPDGEPHEMNTQGSVTSYAWLFAGLDDLAPYNCFHWSLTRSHGFVDARLASYRGTVVADAYEAYAHIEERSDGRIVHASCNAHARREFVKAEAYEPILCAELLALYRRLYAIEERGKLLDVDARRKLRQSDAVPVWKEIEKWLESESVRKAALPSSRFGKAVGYLRNQWVSLQRYLSDGLLPIDNNQAEQIIRPFTVGRNNWLFLGHPRAAKGRLQLLSIVSSAHRHNLIVEDYLTDVLQKLAYATQRNPSLLDRDSEYLSDLLPDRWASAHPTSIRIGRRAEKTDRADAKRVRRARQRIHARAQQIASA